MSQSIHTGTIASFKVGDVLSPDTMRVLEQTGPELSVKGKVVFLSDSGDLKNHFAIMDVGGIHTPLVVPVDRLTISKGKAFETACNTPRKAEEQPLNRTVKFNRCNNNGGFNPVPSCSNSSVSRKKQPMPPDGQSHR